MTPVTNLTLSGFNDDGAKWILGGKAMLWFSNRDGLKSVAQTGATQRDAYAMFFTREAWDRFRLTKEELALVKEAEEQKEKDKPKPAEADKDKDKKETPKPLVVELVLELDGVLTRKAKLTIHSSSLSDALVSKDGETLYYLARFEKGANLWSTNLRFGWLQQANTGLFVVYTDLHTLIDDDLVSRPQPGTDRTLVVKFSRLFDVLN